MLCHLFTLCFSQILYIIKTIFNKSYQGHMTAITEWWLGRPLEIEKNKTNIKNIFNNKNKSWNLFTVIDKFISRHFEKFDWRVAIIKHFTIQILKTNIYQV